MILGLLLLQEISDLTPRLSAKTARLRSSHGHPSCHPLSGR